MPSLLFRSVECASCDHRHDFCLLVGNVKTGQKCDYVCPETGSHVSPLCPGHAEVVHHPPQGAVQLSTFTPAQ